MRREKKNGSICGWELYWHKMLYLAVEVVVQSAFGEKGAAGRIFRVAGERKYVMAYLPPHAAAAAVRGTEFEVHVGRGKDAFALSSGTFAAYLAQAPTIFALLGVNGGRPVSKRLMVALLVLHECRHKARWERRVERLTPKTVLDHLDGRIGKKHHDGFLRFWGEYSMLWRLLGNEKGWSHAEVDAHLVEALGLYFWEKHRVRDASLITKHFPSIVCLAPRG